MIQNISDIISLNNKFPSVVNIKGKCDSQLNCWSVYGILHQCKKCEHLVCARCTNLQKNKCVVCKTNDFKNLEKRCCKCKHIILYFMCYYCNVILKSCYNTYCQSYNLHDVMFCCVKNIGEIAKCEKCR